MKKIFLLPLAIILFIIPFHPAQAQRSKKANNSSTILTDSLLKGFKLRSIGPAFMSGRIADIAIHPEHENTWYVAVGSGGVWKTINAGTTWTPVFDKQSVYSIGCVTIDNGNPNRVWVGTGENVGGRHIGFGDGIYLSEDAGSTWKNMGLNKSEHISKILIHPDDSNIIWVASQGPLWSEGGDRGLYKSVDGGKTWEKTLGDDTWTGVTDIAIDPRIPDIMYAATWQRHRTVAAYMGGGPETGIFKSTDGGDTWKEVTRGLPEATMGKIGLAISPHDPDIVYAAIELERRTGGVYRSEDMGETWEKRSNTVASATGPHYYQELYASPHQFERLYLVDSNMKISDDGGKTFFDMNETNKHVDNHAIAFKDDDPDYLLVGTDGGLYETFDLTETWRYIENLPVTQFYKVAVDDAKPFYNIYGGTQDNSTQGGPSRTDNIQGIQNSDWRVVLNWDGHQPATEPGNPDIIYAERQEGTLSRIDMRTGEVTDIQPQPGPNEPYERFNWDAPILISPHSPTRIYFASQRVWKSDDRGNNWTPISGDLTRDQERLDLPIMGKKQSWDAPWDVLAMSNYNTITSLAESPVQSGLIYAGTDDGLLQVSQDGGTNWRKIEVGNLPGVPSTAFVNDIKADLFDANTVYVALDNHKYGDYSPYLYKSSDMGRSWTSLASDLPKKTLIWRLVQDHVNPDLLFLATEFGVYVSINGGKGWTELQGGVPTISFRDLAIQRRENDLIAASFGRGFYILDDYSPLRKLSEGKLQEEALLFSPRDAWWYIPRSHLDFTPGKGSMGDSHYMAPNPEFGALFTYYLKNGIQSGTAKRKESEKELQDANIDFPGWETLDAELAEGDPQVLIAISDANNQVVRRVYGPIKAGFHRIAWDLRYPLKEGIPRQANDANEDQPAQGLMAPPGTYKAQLYKVANGQVTSLSEQVSFQVEPLQEGAIPRVETEKASAFFRSYEKAIITFSDINFQLGNAMKRIKSMQMALKRTQAEPGKLDQQVYELKKELFGINMELNGSPSKLEIGEKTGPTIGERMFAIYRGFEMSNYGPTGTHLKTMQIINSQLAAISQKLKVSLEFMEVLESELLKAGAPVIEK